MFNKFMENEKKQEQKQEESKTPQQPKMRQIIIETDGSNINVVKADVAGNLELIAILSSILNKLNVK